VAAEAAEAAEAAAAEVAGAVGAAAAPAELAARHGASAAGVKLRRLLFAHRQMKIVLAGLDDRPGQFLLPKRLPVTGECVSNSIEKCRREPDENVRWPKYSPCAGDPE
jgi:hypothetical protein